MENDKKIDGKEQPAEIAPQPKRTRRAFLVAAGGIGLATVLGSAAYVAGGLLNPPKQDAGIVGKIAIQTSIDDGSAGAVPGGGVQTKQLHKPKMINAAEIPSIPPDVAGVYMRRQDNSIFVGTGQVQIMIERDHNGKSAASAKHSGPDVEVVVNHSTKLYDDKTPITLADMEVEKELQQIIAPVASIDEMTAQASSTDGFSVWGQRIGDRVIANIVLHRTAILPIGG